MLVPLLITTGTSQDMRETQYEGMSTTVAMNDLMHTVQSTYSFASLRVLASPRILPTPQHFPVNEMSTHFTVVVASTMAV